MVHICLILLKSFHPSDSLCTFFWEYTLSRGTNKHQKKVKCNIFLKWQSIFPNKTILYEHFFFFNLYYFTNFLKWHIHPKIIREELFLFFWWASVCLLDLSTICSAITVSSFVPSTSFSPSNGKGKAPPPNLASTHAWPAVTSAKASVLRPASGGPQFWPLHEDTGACAHVIPDDTDLALPLVWHILQSSDSVTNTLTFPQLCKIIIPIQSKEL